MRFRGGVCGCTGGILWFNSGGSMLMRGWLFGGACMVLPINNGGVVVIQGVWN